MLHVECDVGAVKMNFIRPSDKIERIDPVSHTPAYILHLHVRLTLALLACVGGRSHGASAQARWSPGVTLCTSSSRLLQAMEGTQLWIRLTRQGGFSKR